MKDDDYRLYSVFFHSFVIIKHTHTCHTHTHAQTGRYATTHGGTLEQAGRRLVRRPERLGVQGLAEAHLQQSPGGEPRHTW